MDKFVIYGAGKIGKSIYSFLKLNNDTDLIYAFCDRDKIKRKTVQEFCDIPVLSYEEVKDKGFSFLIGVGNVLKDEVRNMLLTDEQHFYDGIEEWIRARYPDISDKMLKLLEYESIRNGQNKIEPVKQEHGFCPICQKETIFVSYDQITIRNNYRCVHCQSMPRERSLFIMLEEIEPEWRNKNIHESSPAGVLSDYLKKNCRTYTSSYFYEDKPLGEIIGDNITNQNLENLTFPDESFDIVITQDVFEHVNEPDKAFREVCRVLKKGGVHIFTVPIWRDRKTIPRIRMENGQLVLIAPPVYHGNPISGDGALLTYEWGEDLPQFIDTNPRGITRTRMIIFPRNEKDVEAGLDVKGGPNGEHDIRVVVTEKL